MKRFFIVGLLMCIAATACTRMEEDVPQVPIQEKVLKKGILRVASRDAFASIVEEMKKLDIYDVANLPATRSGEVMLDESFVSLREHLIEQGLQEFTEEQLAEIIADSLEYEPEDSLIVDPYLMAMLNEDRQVQIDNMIYQYIPEGLLIYPSPISMEYVNDSTLVFNPEDLILPDSSEIPDDGEPIQVEDEEGNEAELIPIEYPDIEEYPEADDLSDRIPLDENGRPINLGGNGSGSSSSNSNQPSGLFLADGTFVPEDDVLHAWFEDGEGNGSWLKKAFFSIFKGTRVDLANKFSDDRRMIVIMSDINYYLTNSCEMKVKMQRKKFGIWWRKKADRIYYGWTPIEIEHKFNNKIFFDPGAPIPPAVQPGTGSNITPTKKYPDIMKTKVTIDGHKHDVALIEVPYSEYDFYHGDINAFFNNYHAKQYLLINKWNSYLKQQGIYGVPIGLYTADASDLKMYCIYPPNNSYHDDDRKVVVKWRKIFLQGAISYVYDSTTESFDINDLDFEPYEQSVSIKRGMIYGAVKYGNKIKACAISTR